MKRYGVAATILSSPNGGEFRFLGTLTAPTAEAALAKGKTTYPLAPALVVYPAPEKPPGLVREVFPYARHN